MDDTRTAILNDSNRIISKLQLLSVFFGDEIIYKIYLRSQVIHQLFAGNPELDINKLELFHLQFTQTLVELLRKIKKNNEQNISVLLEEIRLNRELIEKIQGSIYTQDTFRLEQQRQASKVNNSLRKLYQVLSDDSSEYPFAKNINAFSARFSQDFYHPISPPLMDELVQYNAAEVYKNPYAVIQRKLLGTLCKYDFRSSFYMGLQAGELVAEIYRITDTERHYIYLPAKSLFLFCDITHLAGFKENTEISKKEHFVQELTDKNNQLQNKINLVKAQLSPEVKALLTENYKRLNDIDFLQSISDIDAQANILKMMLKTDFI